MSSLNQKTALYIHWPFCAAKCPYCDFNSHVAESIDHEAWAAAYLKEIDRYAAEAPGRRIASIYFGGGTPSLMKPSTVQAIIDRVQQRWGIANDIEITLEANPTSIEAQKFRDFRTAGVNRVSVGVQALNDKDLQFLGRKHTAAEAMAALEIARNNFERMNFDLIYARPEQSLEQWEKELREAVELTRGHLSVYQLTIERNTPFYMRHARGEFKIPEQELAADFYLSTQEILESAGLPAYEVSNHAAAGQESRHNMMYWTYEDYIGIGPGAHGRVRVDGIKYATRGHAAPEKWLSEQSEIREIVSEREQQIEALMTGLRLRGGMKIAPVRSVLKEENLHQAVEQGWIVLSGDTLQATREGWLRLNALIDYITV